MDIQTSISVEAPQDLSTGETNNLEFFALIVGLTDWFRRQGFDIDKTTKAVTEAIHIAWEETKS